MSGGHFDYKDYIIGEIAETVEQEIRNNRKPYKWDELDYWERNQYSKREYEALETKPLHSDWPSGVIDRMKDAVKVLRLAAIYAHRLDWLLSGDDGEESFAHRLDKELAELERKEAEDDVS